MSSIAVITARGGSKRIPHKNIKDFCGKPIIAYSIEAALESGLFDEVMVSTDDEEIAEIARVFGASVPFMRSSSTSDDYATTSDVLLEVLDAYESQGRTFDSLCCIYPTAPFVTAGKLHAARSLFEDGADTVLVVTEYSFPPQRGLVETSEGLSFWQPENAMRRSQDLPAVYHDAGQLYFRNAQSFHKYGGLFGGMLRGLVVPQMEVQDIDNLADWQLAELKYERMALANGFENV
ncbi:pseudaminic acid cytidylyltransferase [Eggerthella lenta]|uniref:pseudaminic acid cytidylyltransferase n=1 Tax=Eggerthella lenta TaxID=84112 RepID=UPI001D06C9E5|nr:pseudaminic acid cytidylyltransferase [Eggerthella lenta]MCB7059118.1 pseudaminic acid cytidylyltransferase [Eggerthella lenta]